MGWGQQEEFRISVPISALEDATRCEAGDHRRYSRSNHRRVLGCFETVSLINNNVRISTGNNANL